MLSPKPQSQLLSYRHLVQVGSGAPAAAPAAGGGLDAPLLAKDGHKAERQGC